MHLVRVIVATLIAVLGAGTNVFATIPAGPPTSPDLQRVRWRSRSITIAVSSSVLQPNSNFKPDSDVAGAIKRSVDAWRAVGFDIQLEFTDRQSVSASGAAGDGISLLTVAQTPENVMFFSKNPFGESAKTRVFFNRKGNITEADIVLNPFEQFSTDGSFGTFDLEATIKHEIGHLLGLHHSAVWGAVMADSIPRNGSNAERVNSDLSESDVAAVRDLYGAADDDDNCCSTISGRITTGERLIRDVRVWAEETETGRVVSQARVAQDGSYRMGGLAAGSYTVNWQRSDADGKLAGTLGSVKVGRNEAKAVSDKIPAARTSATPSMIGSFGQLADSVLRVKAGREYSLVIGGKQLDANSCTIEFSSPLIRVRPGSVSSDQFEGDVTALRFSITADEKLPAGVYTVYVSSGGSRSALIGAVRVN